MRFSCCYDKEMRSCLGRGPFFVEDKCNINKSLSEGPVWETVTLEVVLRSSKSPACTRCDDLAVGGIIDERLISRLDNTGFSH